MSDFNEEDIGQVVGDVGEACESGRPDKPFTALSEIRQLVEGFYDIQHLRIETYNRIVAYVKQNAVDIILFLSGRSHKYGEYHNIYASHLNVENQPLNASHIKFENQKEVANHTSIENHSKKVSRPLFENHVEKASQAPNETQERSASHCTTENHIRHASRKLIENQIVQASHIGSETHKVGASHSVFENHTVQAIKFLEGKEYSKFVDMILAVSASDEPSGKPRGGRKPKSHFTVETQRKNASQNHFETHAEHANHNKIENRMDKVSQKDDVNQLENASHIGNVTHTNIAKRFNVPFTELVRPIVAEIDNLVWFYNRMLVVEVGLGKRLNLWSMSHPLRVKFLSRVYGIGGIFSSGIIAWLDEPIKKSEYVSSIWRYCGLTPDSKRVAGKKTDYDVKLKSFCWKISTSFIKFHCFGRELYLQFKRDVKHKHPEPVQAVDENGKLLFYRKSGEPKMLWTPKHIDLYARRKVVKLFLSSVWETWRKMNGLPVGQIYPIANLGHKHYIAPERWMEKRPVEAG